MNERPILFSGPMVRAILSGSKTQTRRVVKPQPAPKDTWDWAWPIPGKNVTPGTHAYWRDDYRPNLSRYCPFQEGMRLWVRETFCNSPDGVIYRATEHEHGITPCDDYDIWKPSIFMPRWASRITLEITAVRVERVQDISEADARAEGIHEFDLGVNGKVYGTNPCAGRDVSGTAVEGYAILWDSINAKRGYPWNSNPWVWVLEFQRVEATP